eukprot:205042-Chlamydomonas_euryale.AAC.1
MASAAAAAPNVNVNTSGSAGQQQDQRAGSVGDGGDSVPLITTEVTPEPAVGASGGDSALGG